MVVWLLTTVDGDGEGLLTSPENERMIKSFDVNNLNNTKPYLDFWHEFIRDHEYFIHNGGYVPVDFEDVIGTIIESGTPEDQWTA